ncbi:MAG: hypothetical protein RR598_10550 [Anaerorhabdus sp.]|uniref:hypothetical protein n=1 Tax=Anaerorhabdus sp. TaxID=1872524 RepID=UPI002FC81CB0
MKIGIRKPSLKKTISARTTGKLKRSVKKAVIPGYGQKGMGLLNPKKAIYNKVYNKATVSAFDLSKNNHEYSNTENESQVINNQVSREKSINGLLNAIIIISLLVIIYVILNVI